jgi:selenocysteine lyase/cysteine desulfurase
MTLVEAQRLWQPETLYLNTASYGLPPAPARDEFQAVLGDWRGGRTSWEGWGDYTESARASFARLVGVPAEWVAIGANTSSMVALVAAALPDGARVLSAEPEFTSLLWPFLVQERGIEVEYVPIPDLADSQDERTDAVAVSAVQSSTGEVADLDAVVEAAAAYGARVVVDGTQACGWLPVDARRIDVLACSAYKWLCSPRGTAFMSVRPELGERVTPHAAGWYAGEDPYASFYGPPLRLAKSARRFDVSPAWFPWVAAAPTLDLLPRDRHRRDPRARPPPGQPLPGPARTAARRLGDRLGRAAGGRGAAPRLAGDGGGTGRPAADVLARPQHR